MMHCAHLTIHGFIGMGLHGAVLAPVPPPPVPTPHVSMQTLLGLGINAKWSKTVIGPFGFQFIGKNNDSGFMVPHICIPPNNTLIPLIIAFGGSKVMFSASTVKMDVDGAGTPMAACLLPFVPLSKNQACNDPVNLPSDNVIAPNTVVVGLTLGDVIGGVINIVVDMVTSFIMGKIGGAVSERITGRIVSAALRAFKPAFARVFGREFAERVTRDAAEQIINQVVDKFVGYGLGQAEGVDSNLAGNLIQDDWQDAGTAAGGAIDSPATGSSIASSASGLTNNTPGAAPIYDAD